jgi:hypothetical protein
VAAFVSGLRKKNATEAVFDAGDSTIGLSWTNARARTLRLGQRLDVRIAFAPACQGKMTFVLISAWQPGSAGAATAEAWMKSVKVGDASAACEGVRTLRDPGEGMR